MAIWATIRIPKWKREVDALSMKKIYHLYIRGDVDV